MRRTTRALIAIALVAFAIGMSLMPLQTPLVTRTLVARVGDAQTAGLSIERVIVTAESVRRFVVSGSGSLPETVDGRPGFDAAAVAHLIDVRRVLGGARVTVAALGVFLALVIGAGVRRRRFDDLEHALRLAAVLTASLPAMGLLVALLDFDRFFAGFHALFFAAGTWVFPADSLLILTFPETFWVVCGVAWALLVGVFAAGYSVAGAVLRRRLDGGSGKRAPDPVGEDA